MPEDARPYLTMWSGFLAAGTEPPPVATTFESADENGDSLSDVARLDTMVTGVGAANLLRDFSGHDLLADRSERLVGADARRLVGQLTDQIEFVDVFILNKVTDAGHGRVAAAHKIRDCRADRCSA